MVCLPFPRDSMSVYASVPFTSGWLKSDVFVKESTPSRVASLLASPHLLRNHTSLVWVRNGVIKSALRGTI